MTMCDCSRYEDIYTPVGNYKWRVDRVCTECGKVIQTWYEDMSSNEIAALEGKMGR